MNIVMNRHSLEIVPEGPTDEIYLEHVLGREHSGDRMPLVIVQQGDSGAIALFRGNDPDAQ